MSRREFLSASPPAAQADPLVAKTQTLRCAACLLQNPVKRRMPYARTAYRATVQMYSTSVTLNR
jgi:hypothetical protein